MRRSLPLLMVLFCTSAFSQFNIQYNFARPVGEQGKHITQMHGAVISFDVKLKNAPFYVSPEIGLNIYGLKTLEQELPFDNGYVTKTNVNYNTSMNTYGVALRFQPSTGKNFQPFLAVRTGVLHYYSNMTIEDPEDPLGCRALEKKVLVKDLTWMASGGAGFRLDGKAFSGKESRIMLDFGAFYTYGGEAEYLKMSNSHDHSADPKSQDYYVKFEHIPSGDVHEHALGRIYRTATQLLEFRLGVQFKLD
jgi:hypothetical protein